MELIATCLRAYLSLPGVHSRPHLPVYYLVFAIPPQMTPNLLPNEMETSPMH
jgi:hypothetical protein